MNDIDKKLTELTEGNVSSWHYFVKERMLNKAWQRKASRLAIEILAVLRKQGLTQKDLAERMGVSPQQVNKIVKGSENLTLETISKLEMALGVTLVLIGKPSGQQPESALASAVAEPSTSYHADDDASNKR